MLNCAPDVVGVDRMFMVELQLSPNAGEAELTVPDGIELVDQSPQANGSETRRFYFRAYKAQHNAEIRFNLPSEVITVPLEIFSFDDLREYRKLKGTLLPRRWPLGNALPELKRKQTITGVAEYENGEGDPIENAKQWLEASDEQIWAVQPDTTIPRSHYANVHRGCPVHGPEIFLVREYYPWDRDVSLPHQWKLRCPLGGETYPSNDFASDDMTSGPYPDDGLGYVNNDDRYGLIAEMCLAYCRQALSIAPACASAYVASGDNGYVHKALIAFCRLAVEYSYLATMTHHRFRFRGFFDDAGSPATYADGPFLSHSGFGEYSINQPGAQARHAEAYDKIFPAIDQDTEIIPFLRAKGFDLQTGEDLRRFIEENLFAVWMQASMDNACASNEPYQQWGFTRMAEVLDYSRGTDFMDWLYDGNGKMRFFVTNCFFRDGAAPEATGGYNAMHVHALVRVVESIERLRRLRPELYPESKYPVISDDRRYRTIFDFVMDSLLIDRTFPPIGDCGTYPKYEKLPKTTWHQDELDPWVFEHVYRHYPASKYAWALAHHPHWQPSTKLPFTREHLEKEASELRDDWNDRSTLHDGYGLAILRSGVGDDKRAFWLKYGRARSHAHDDVMHIGLHGHESTLLGHMGYPRQWSDWEYNWITHILGRQFPCFEIAPTAQLFADAGPVHLAEVLAQGYRDRSIKFDGVGNYLTELLVQNIEQRVDEVGYDLQEDDWQRRMIVIVDVGPNQFYCLDFYRMSGGHEHWYSFHAQQGEFTTQGLKPQGQAKGTLAGSDVEYANQSWLEANTKPLDVFGWVGPKFGFAHLYNVQRAQPNRGWSADWALKDADGLHLRLTVPLAEGTDVVICDGKSPSGGSPYEMKWVLHHQAGKAPLSSQLLSIIEPYRHKPTIQQAHLLPLSGGDEHGLPAYGCAIQLAEHTDTVFYSADPAVARTTDNGFEFAGRFGLYREQDGIPTEMVLAGGTRLSKGNFTISLDSAEHRSRIIEVDRSSETITVSPPPPEPEKLVGQNVFIHNRNRRTAHKVLAANVQGDAATLQLDLDSRIGTGLVTGVQDHRVLTSTPFILHGHRYYHGARLVNADATAEYQLIDVRDRMWAIIDAQTHPHATADVLATQFQKGSWFDAYVYGIGDEIDFPYMVHVKRDRDNVYKVTGPSCAVIDLPEGYVVERQN